MINKFIKTCIENGEKTAFFYGKRKASFSKLLTDTFKMANLFKERGISKGSKVLLFVLPSYEFYVLLFACIYYGINVVVLDSYKSVGRIKKIMADNEINLVFCNSHTRIANFIFDSETSFINVSDYHKYSSSPIPENNDKNRIVLTTFTSGTTGKPKPIERSIKNLEAQIETVSKNVEMEKEDVVYAGLPIYVLFVVYSGVTCVISKKITKKELYRLGVNTVLAPISKLLSIKENIPFVNKLFLGGAMLYENEAKKLRNAFPFAQITYIYGSSECVLMAKSNVEHYLNHNFGLSDKISGVELEITSKDCNGIGRIKAIGEVVLTENYQFVGNDLGYFDEYGLHIVGRNKYSTTDFYNYIEDNKLLKENPKVEKGFSFAYKEKRYFCYQGKLSKTYTDINCVRFRKLPMDPKHKTKLDYVSVIEKLKL